MIVRNILILSRAFTFISSHFRLTVQYYSHIYGYILCTNDLNESTTKSSHRTVHPRFISIIGLGVYLVNIFVSS